MTCLSSPAPGSILDIGGGGLERYLKERLEFLLSDASENSKTPYLPEEFLYLGSGLHIWRNLVFHPSYYQTHDEIKLFQKNGKEIASYISSKSTLVDLGSGNLDKIETLLSVLEEREMQVTYVAVDINREYLEHAISSLSQKHTKVVCQGAYGTFGDAWQWCKNLPSPKVLICLGSSFLRGTREEALATLRSWAELLQPEDLMIIGADGHLAPDYCDKIWKMYHSDDAGWQQLWDNAFAVVNDVVGEKWFHSDDWKLDATIVPGTVSQHRWRFRAQRDLTLGDSGITFRKGDELGWLDAHKFSRALVHELCGLAGLAVVRTWQVEGSEMHQYLITSGDN